MWTFYTLSWKNIHVSSRLIGDEFISSYISVSKIKSLMNMLMCI